SGYLVIQDCRSLGTRTLFCCERGVKGAPPSVNFFAYEAYFYIDYISKTCYIASHPRSLRGVVRRHPEGGAGSGVLRRRLVIAGSGRPGKSPARHYDLAARSSLHGSEGNCPPLYGGGRRRRRKRGPEAQNRHGGAPRGERPASWDARRLARRMADRVMMRPTGGAHSDQNE